MDARNQTLYDVFLSHSSKDKKIVQKLAQRLASDGLRVWFYGWEVLSGDDAPAKIKLGLEKSRVLVLCMSQNAFDSEWAQLESATFQFRDPQNKDHRFIPIRLDDTPVKASLAQFFHLNWRSSDEQDREYPKLLDACRVPSEQATAQFSPERTGRLAFFATAEIVFSSDCSRSLSVHDDGLRIWDVASHKRLVHLARRRGSILTCVAWSADGRRLLFGGTNSPVYYYDLDCGRPLAELLGTRYGVMCLAFSPDGLKALSAGRRKSVEVWDLRSSYCLHVLEGHSASVLSLAWNPFRPYAISGSQDRLVMLWNLENGECEQVFAGHAEAIKTIAWAPDGYRFLSGSEDLTLRLWDCRAEFCQRVLEGHSGQITALAWNPDNRHALSGASDRAIRLWDLDAGHCVTILKGHDSAISAIAWMPDGSHAISADRSGYIKVWNLSQFLKSAPSSMPYELEQVQYTNAKVLLVGDSGVGKTGLSNYLALEIKDEERNISSDGAWATQWSLPCATSHNGVAREIWLWDFAGQVDYRLVHQLYMDETAAAVLVFNPQNENPFDGLGRWNSDLNKASRKPFSKLLVAARIDRGGLVVSQAQINEFIQEHGFLMPLYETSSRTGAGCDELRDAIVNAIDWQTIPRTTSPILYEKMKEEILRLRDSGTVLLRLAELKQRMELALTGEQFEFSQLETAVSLLAGPGIIQLVDFGGFILLRPEVLSRYAAALIRKIRKHPKELGCIREDELLEGELDYQDFDRLPEDDEAVLLRILHKTMISRAWCLRQPCDGSSLLTFPNYFRRERPEQSEHPKEIVTYRFSGPIDDIYATLIVRLHYTEAFNANQIWRHAADFETQTGKYLGIKLTIEEEGIARLDVYFRQNVDADSQVLFLKYIHKHLIDYADSVKRLRHYSCGNRRCDSYGQIFGDRSRIDKALAPEGKGRVFCPDCGKPIILRDVVEEKFESPAFEAKARKMQIDGQIQIDNESRELLAVHHTGFVVAEAGQIYRSYSNSDHGIDGEIEFKDDQGRATGERLYVQLKSGDSYLTKRKRDGIEIFKIKKARWAYYWQDQAYPVMLVIRASDGEIRWMNISDYLKQESNKEGKLARQILFTGERFDAMAVRRIRQEILSNKPFL